jgi:hypothetical protein
MLPTHTPIHNYTQQNLQLFNCIQQPTQHDYHIVGFTEELQDVTHSARVTIAMVRNLPLTITISRLAIKFDDVLPQQYTSSPARTHGHSLRDTRKSELNVNSKRRQS